jgi:hypothetical protein
VLVRNAPEVRFRGANSPSPDKPGEVDCNSPAHWDGETLFLFNSAGHPWRLAGPDLLDMAQDYRSCAYDTRVAGGRWIECTWKAEDGTLYGWYHFEPAGICPGAHPASPKMNLTAPRIGAVRSKDNGATWEDLGIVLDAEPFLKCDTRNYYFAGGNGDFSIMRDPRAQYVYFFISTYVGDASEQGVAIARMSWADRDQPVGKVWKFHEGGWNSLGLGGKTTPIFPAKVDWHQADADAFWGPAIHWNTHLRQYVMLLNRTKDSNWSQEGVYISFNSDLADPKGWTTPTKILESIGNDRWYPQVMGLDKTRHETDKVAGKVARLFIRGTSRWELVFLKPGE